MGCPNETLLRFLAEMVHPLVRPDQEKVTEIVDLVNGFLARDGYQLEVASVISGKRIFVGVATIGQQAAGTDEAKRVADDMASEHVAGPGSGSPARVPQRQQVGAFGLGSRRAGGLRALCRL